MGWKFPAALDAVQRRESAGRPLERHRRHRFQPRARLVLPSSTRRSSTGRPVTPVRAWCYWSPPEERSPKPLSVAGPRLLSSRGSLTRSTRPAAGSAIGIRDSARPWRASERFPSCPADRSTTCFRSTRLSSSRSPTVRRDRTPTPSSASRTSSCTSASRRVRARDLLRQRDHRRP
jgi:hypothetical protein